MAALATVLIWASYFISLRLGALSSMAAGDLALFRFAVPAMLLLPLFLRQRQRLLAVPRLWQVGLLVGGGLPFFLLGAVAMQWSPVAHGSTLIPGVAPLFVTFLAVWLFAQPLSASKRVGIAAIAIGVVALLLNSWLQGNAQLAMGQGLFLLASLLWAVFTISVRQSGLSPLDVAAWVCVPSGCLLLLVALLEAAVHGQTPAFLHLSWQQWLPQLLVQGVLVGLGAGYLYGYAIRQLGAELTSAIGSLTPVAATVAAAMFLHETVELTTLAGLFFVTLGVVFASGLIAKRR
ncbi:EamA family transporter [Bacterioplanes sanyensis]|uniref:EamA family transporter n=2 Tax=Bacterioplanes sanyensis TaxID=1249553 RepID=A0A222FQZ5_9GAMM|nr:EamA family transporter [Bacterioplanes sanyensis]